MQSFVKCLFRDTSTKFYWSRFIFDRHRAKYKLARKVLRRGVHVFFLRQKIWDVFFWSTQYYMELSWNKQDELRVQRSVYECYHTGGIISLIVKTSSINGKWLHNSAAIKWRLLTFMWFYLFLFSFQSTIGCGLSTCNKDYDNNGDDLAEGRRDVNVALRRPAWQSSVYLNYASLRADKSNDGNTGTSIYGDPTCSHTIYQLHPWWAVDLGSPLHVDGVNFTNRADGAGGCRL